MAELSRDEVLKRVQRGEPVARADLREIDLSHAVLERADLRRSDLEGANLEGARLAGAQLRNVSLREAYLVAADLREANLENADLEGARLEGADLRGANLSRASLEGANLTGARLAGAQLSYAQLESARLGSADLTDAVLVHAELAEAYLGGARLCRAKLTGAVLTGANLEEADLRQAELTGADFTGANLTGVKSSNGLSTRPKNGAAGGGTARYFGRGDVLRGATLRLDDGARVEVESLFEQCTIELGEGTELVVGTSGVLADCTVIGHGRILISGKFYEHKSPGIVGPTQVVVSSGGCLVAEVEQAAEATQFAFEPGSNLRVKIRPPKAAGGGSQPRERGGKS
jgi:uncharacterized protein YjbI with pentapeptide repeats